MTQATQNANHKSDDAVYSRLDDENFAELLGLCAQRIVHATVWDETILAALDSGAARTWAQDTFDIDLYLGDGVYFELFGVCCYPALDADPLETHDTVTERLADLVTTGIWLEEIAADEEENLVLVLARRRQPVLYLAVSAWSLHEWEELPTDEVTLPG
jgi:hypothetical protein